VQIRIDVVIVTYQSAATVSAALASVSSSSLVARTVVVDNASSDGSLEAARRGGAHTVLASQGNVGFAAGVNNGLGDCHSEYVLLLNPDATLDAAALEDLAAALDSCSAAAMAGPALVSDGGDVMLGARRFSTAVNRLAWHVPLPRRPQWSTPEYAGAARMLSSASPLPVDYLWGAALLVRRRFLEEIGGLDERFFLYSEDEDLGRQARARGYQALLVPRARARHIGGASTPDAALAQARVIAANAQLLDKWEGKAAALWYRRAIGPVLALRAAVLRVAGRRAEARLAARIRGMLRSSSHDLLPRATGTTL
jgi:N-acetylglucosaminyl-diphospho-decaprenol L-rhamnosyltransferase